MLTLKQMAEQSGASAEFEALALKCGPAIEYWRPYGGATTFDAIDEQERGQEIQYEGAMLTEKMRAIINNVIDDETIDAGAKQELISRAATDFASRAGELPRIDGKDLHADDEPSWFTKALARLGWKQTPAQAAGEKDAIAAFLEDDASIAGSMVVTKDASGNYRWLAVYSNKWYDKDQEVFPESDHKEFIQWLDATKAYPELWLWHTPGTRIGQADWADYSTDGFALASGGFDPGMEDVAERLASDKNLGVSHGFKFRQRDASRAIKGYRSFEISPLPRGREANAGTSFSAAVKEAAVLSAAKRAFIVEKLGEDRTKQVEAALGVMATEMTNKGVSFKEAVEDFLATPQGSPAEAAKSVPPGSPPSATPGTTATPPAPAAFDLAALKEVVGSAVKEATAPLEAKLGELETGMKAIDPTWVPKGAPASAPMSVANKEAPAFAANDPIAQIAAAATKAVNEANGETGDDPAPLEGIKPIGWHMGAMFGGQPGTPAVDAVTAAPSANGVGAGV